MTTKKQGFSLIELMVVIAIISVLASIALPSYQTYALKAKFAKTRPTVENALETYMELIAKGASYGQISNDIYQDLHDNGGYINNIGSEPDNDSATGSNVTIVYLSGDQGGMPELNASIPVIRYQTVDNGSGVYSWKCYMVVANNLYGNPSNLPFETIHQLSFPQCTCDNC